MDKVLVKDFIKEFIIAVVIVLIISLFVRPTIVRETSMLPTVADGDYLLVNKMAYINEDHPKHGDIIVFKKDNGTFFKRLLIKRVIGVEGDTITVQKGNVYINGNKLTETYINSTHTDGDISNYVIPKDKIFVLGDNRGVSLDSREFGVIAEDDVVGKAAIRLFPFTKVGRL